MKIQSNWQVVGDALQLGASIVLAIFIGLFLGIWLDDLCGTRPYLSIIFFFLGIAAAGRNVWLAVRKQLREDEEKRHK
jgi:ATP synthase protein I